MSRTYFTKFNTVLTNPNTVVENYSDDTCFDEYLEKHVGTKINMDLLEDYLKASDDLHDLKLYREVEGLKNTDIYLTYSHIEDETYYNASGDEISREDFILIKEAVDYVGKIADNDITILPTYTALLKLNAAVYFARADPQNHLLSFHKNSTIYYHNKSVMSIHCNILSIQKCIL